MCSYCRSEPVPEQNSILPTWWLFVRNSRHLCCSWYTVEVVSGTSQTMSTSHCSGARFRFVVVHGDKYCGLECGWNLAWSEIPVKLDLRFTRILSCHSGDVEVRILTMNTVRNVSPDALFPLVEGHARRVNALITATGRSHHFRWRFQDNSHLKSNAWPRWLSCATCMILKQRPPLER